MSETTTEVLWHEGDLIGFDTETTGTDPDDSRIVEASVVLSRPDGRFVEQTVLINPGVPIPADATEVHGITDERVKDEGMAPVEALTLICSQLAYGRLPVVAFNAVFDLTILERECRRHGVRPYMPTFVIDPLVIDRHVNKYVSGVGQRRLRAVAQRYGVELADWHSASSDARAALDVARAMGRQRQVPPDVATLTAWQVRWKATQQASLQDYLRRNQQPGEAAINLDPRWPLLPLEEPTPIIWRT